MAVKGGGVGTAASPLRRQAPSRVVVHRILHTLAICGIFFVGLYNTRMLQNGLRLGCGDESRASKTVQPKDDDVVALQMAAKRWLRPWERVGVSGGGISQGQVTKVFQFLQQGEGVGSVRIQVINGVLQEPAVVKDWLKSKVYYQPRLQLWMALFRHIEATLGLPDYLDIIVCTEDQAFLPISFEHLGGAPIFTYASTLGHYDIPIPTMEYYGYKLKDVNLEAVTAQRWEERIGAPAIWRGSPTGGLYTKENYRQKQRYQLVNTTKHYPALIDARMMPCAPGQCTDEAWALMEEELLTGGSQVKYPDYIKHKFLIDIDGNAWSSRFILLLSTGCVIFKIDTPYVEYFNEFLVPYKHYIPVASDSSDLPEKIQYAVDHDDDMRAISENLISTFGRFIANGRWELYVKRLLTEYSRLLIRPSQINEIER